MERDWVWVDEPEKLETAEADIRNSAFVGVDTEYDSFRYFRSKLCLIQIISGTKTYLFDPFENCDISFLGDVFADFRIIKIMHAGDNDVRILNRDYGFVFNNIFDTNRAASLLGCKHLSLSNVVYRYLGIPLNKSKKMQRSRWESRPLTEDQINYAVKDTHYLPDLYRILYNALKTEGLEEKACEVFSVVEMARWSEKTLDPYGYLKIEGSQELSGLQRKRLKSLYLWRFKKALKTNTARFMILTDQNLLDLARARLDTLASLDEAGVISPRKAKDYGSEIIEKLKNCG